MFENCIGQQHVITRLSQDIINSTLPSSLLFYGSQYSGKLTTALELSRILTCKEKGEWACPCPECEKQRLLIHPQAVMLGKRYFIQEITACGEVFRQHQKTFAQYMFIRSVRKLTRRFDPDFLDESAKSNAFIQKAQALEEMIEGISPSNGIPDSDKIEKLIQKITSESKKLADSMPESGITVDQIRRLSFWAHTTGTSERKVIILENADLLLESSRNALLKILEEPPENVYFILLSERKSSLIPTILSRVRPYTFLQRDEKSSSDVLKKIFREESGEYKTLQEYFLASGDIDPVHLHNVTDNFIAMVFAEGCYNDEVYSVIDEISSASRDVESGICYLEELLRQLQIVMREKTEEKNTEPLFIKKIHLCFDLIHHWKRNIMLLNMKPQNSVEAALYKMLEVLH